MSKLLRPLPISPFAASFGAAARAWAAVGFVTPTASIFGLAALRCVSPLVAVPGAGHPHSAVGPEGRHGRCFGTRRHKAVVPSPNRRFATAWSCSFTKRQRPTPNEQRDRHRLGASQENQSSHRGNAGRVRRFGFGLASSSATRMSLALLAAARVMLNKFRSNRFDDAASRRSSSSAVGGRSHRNGAAVCTGFGLPM